MEQELLRLIETNKVTFFVGAGISMIPPSCLPSWWQINHAILDALAEESAVVAKGTYELAEGIKKREEDGKLPPEFVAETIVGRIGKSYFDVLKCLEGKDANKIHLWIATLAKAGLLKAIITTNFDTLIERACEALGVSLKVLVHPKDYDSVNWQDTPNECLLLKLHGTASEPQTCIDTLAQRKQGLHSSVIKGINSLGENTTWVILGYSGADLDAEPNYLGIRARRDNTPGFYWLHLPNRKPIAAVADLVAYYNNNQAKIVFGELPQWFENMEEVRTRKRIFGKKITKPDVQGLTQEQINILKETTTQMIRAETKKWAHARGETLCCIILTDIAIQANLWIETEAVLNPLLDRHDEYALTDFGNGIFYEELGNISQHLGKSQPALDYFKKSYGFYQKANDQSGMYITLTSAGQLYLSFGYYTEAEKLFKGYLDYSRQINDPDDIVRALTNLGNLYRTMGKYAAATEVLEEALPIATQNGLEMLRADCLLGLGIGEFTFGNMPKSLEFLSQAISVYTRLGNLSLESEALRHLAQIYLKQGHIQEGLQKLSDSKVKAEAAGNKQRVLEVDRILGEYLLRSGNYNDGEKLLRATAQAAEQMSLFNIAIITWQSVGVALQSQSNNEAAGDLFQRALKLAEEHGQEVIAAGLKNNIGIIAEQKGDLNSAINFYQQATVIFERVNDVESLAQSKGNTANILYRLERLSEAKEAFEETLKIFQQLGNIDGILRTLPNLANVLQRSGDFKQAKEYYLKAIQMAEQYKQIGLKDIIQFNYANFLMQRDEYPDALTYLKATSVSCTNRKDFNMAGLAYYYAGFIYVKMQDKQNAVNLLKQALAVWDQLEERPAQYTEVVGLLQQLG